MSDEAIDSKAIDNLLATVGNDKAFLSELINTFLIEAPKLLRALNDALASENTTDLRRAAHTLKSNSANFGAVTLARLCQELEARARDGVMESSAERIAEIEVEFTRVRSALRQL